jgi:diguanylate cyclase (GGDEF)-like protein
VRGYRDLTKDGLDKALKPWTEARRLQGELKTTRARIAALEAERTDLLRKDRRAGVLTRDAFREAATASLTRSRRKGTKAAIVLADIDGFRALNGRRGAAAGDAALATVGERLRELVRGGDLVGRTGADELAVLMPEAGAEGARACAERLVSVLELSGPVTVSAGVAVDTGQGDLDALLAAAAEGVERARQAGGGRVGAMAPRVPTPVDPARGAVGALALALLERDRDTGEHSEQVVGLASGVARRLGLEGEELERIAAAALLHDVGKVGVPDRILNKPGPLDSDEWGVMRRHPEVGERIVRAVPGLGAVARIVRHCHERWDGAGYPDALHGEEIPLGSRIVLACEAYHAMTSRRPFRAALGHEAAVEELRASAGTQLDPRVVDALLAHLGERPLERLAAPRVAPSTAPPSAFAA